MPFVVDQADVPRYFTEWWSRNHVGIAQPHIKRVHSLFAPFWVFESDVDIPSANVYRRFAEGPHMMMYSGAAYPRPMMEVAKNDIANAKPFSGRMLDIDQGRISVDVEPFELFEATAWQLARSTYLKAELERLQSDPAVHSTPMFNDARFYNVRSHRVLQPVHVVEYSYMFETFRVFINGYTGQAFGIQQQSLSSMFSGITTGSLLDRLAQITPLLRFLQRHFPPQMVFAILNSLAILLRPMLRLILWPPFLVGSLLALGGYTVSLLTSGLRQHKRTLAEWEETKRAEAAMQASMSDEWQFRPQGESAADRERARRREKEEQERYQQQQQQQRRSREDDASRARRERERQQEDAQRRQQQQQQQAKAKPAAGKRPPPVDPSDYYAVLGLRRTASEEDIKSAFRRELMRYHPDHAVEAGMDADACSERTRFIINAYGTLRDRNKRRLYDASYRGAR